MFSVYSSLLSAEAVCQIRCFLMSPYTLYKCFLIFFIFFFWCMLCESVEFMLRPFAKSLQGNAIFRGLSDQVFFQWFDKFTFLCLTLSYLQEGLAAYD